ncbi:MFS transporter [Streptomyces hoynatensis]|uniref:MFS transporter n=1 Tax=Streptomyces hoynatensis TaxID=1141874 RepID=A0A3A9ZBV8_9ACTN|nr:MFS transporter [Streptomyces hoynatensis]RKN45675.1 MFS transporter [Streptomyces hoynatensis]
MADRPAARGGGVLIGALVVDAIGNGLFMPLSLIFFVRLTDVSLSSLGVLMSVATALTLPLPLVTGALADRIGALPLVVAAQGLQAAGYFGYGTVHGPVGVFLSVSLVAFGVRIFWSAIFTAVADYADGSASAMSTDSWFALANMARTAGLGVGGLATGLVAAGESDAAYRAVAWAATGCFAAAGAAIALWVRAPRSRREDGGRSAGYGTMLADRAFLALTGLNTVFAMTSMMLALALPTFVLTGLKGPSWVTPAVLVGNTVAVSLLAAPVVKRLAPYRRSRILLAAAVLWAGWCLVWALLRPGAPGVVIPALIGATALFTLAEVMHAPVSQALVTALSPLAARGRYLAVFQYSFTLAGIVAPAFFTSLFGLHRALPWAVLGAVNCLAALGMLLLERVLPEAALREAPRRGDPVASGFPARD